MVTQDENNRIFKSLANLIKPSLYQKYCDWAMTATGREIKGCNILFYIYETRGHKKASNSSLNIADEQDIDKLLQGKFDYKASQEYFVDKNNASAYSKDFGYIKKILPPQPTIFAHKNIKELEYKDFLQEMAIQFIDTWITLKDDNENQNLVLDCLRSLNSRHRAYQKAVSETKDHYNDKKFDWNLSKPIIMKQSIKAEVKPDYNAIFKQKMKKQGINPDDLVDATE